VTACTQHFQKALVYFWEGQPGKRGRKALSSALELARREKEPYSQFEIGLALAQLSENNAAALEQAEGGRRFPSRSRSLEWANRIAIFRWDKCCEKKGAVSHRRINQPEVAQDAISKLETICGDHGREPDRREQLRIRLAASRYSHRGDYANARR